MEEKSFVLLKPDAYLRKYIGVLILKEFEYNKNFKITSFDIIKASKELAQKHYLVHKDKPFYSKLVDYLTLSPVIALIIKGNNVINQIRTMLGNTFSNRAEKNSIRGKYGIWAGINCVHASDAISSADSEIKLWKNKAKLEEVNPNISKERINEYTKKWEYLDINHTLQLRNLCEELSKNSININLKSKEKLFNLLKEECVDSDEFTVMQFTEIIIDNLV